MTPRDDGPSLPRLEIINEGAVGIGTKTMVDGEVVHGLTGIDLNIGLNESNKAVLSLITSGIAVDIRADVRYSVGIIDPLDGRYEVTVAADPIKALEGLVAMFKAKR